MLHMIGHIIFGLVIGLIAEFIMPRPHPGGIIVTILLGIAGAWVGGLIGRMLGLYPEGHPAGFFMALLGAIILLVIYHFAAGSGPVRTRSQLLHGSPKGSIIHPASIRI